jgi:hypothetical protein
MGLYTGYYRQSGIILFDMGSVQKNRCDHLLAAQKNRQPEWHT